jgi:hypothetical protein
LNYSRIIQEFCRNFFKQKSTPMHRELFGKLQEDILNKFKKDCTNPPTTDVALFGFNEHENEENNIRAFMGKDPSVSSYLKSLNAEKEGEKKKVEKKTHINGKYLYNKIQEWKGKAEDIKITPFYEAVFLKYLGYESMVAFKESYDSARVFTKYKCFFYSFRYHKIREFSMEIDFQQGIVRQKGIHQYDTNIEYKGNFVRQRSCIDIRLTNEANDSISMLGYVGDIQEPQRMKIISIAVLFKASEGFPMAVEALMYRIDKEDENNDWETSQGTTIKKFLNLKRNNFRISPEITQKTEGLTVKRTNVEFINNMISTYRIWSYDSNHNIIQTKFIVNSDYTADLFTSYNDARENKQTCLLNISTVIRPTLVVSAHPLNGMGLLSYALIEIAHANDLLIEGVFCTVGIRGERHRRTARPIILLREQRAFEPEIILEESLNDYINGDKNLKKMKDRLDSLQ